MSKKHLLLTPHHGHSKDAWWYEENGGISIYATYEGKSGDYPQFDTIGTHHYSARRQGSYLVFVFVILILICRAAHGVSDVFQNSLGAGSPGNSIFIDIFDPDSDLKLDRPAWIGSKCCFSFDQQRLPSGDCFGNSYFLIPFFFTSLSGVESGMHFAVKDLGFCSADVNKFKTKINEFSLLDIKRLYQTNTELRSMRRDEFLSGQINRFTSGNASVLRFNPQIARRNPQAPCENGHHYSGNSSDGERVKEFKDLRKYDSMGVVRGAFDLCCIFGLLAYLAVHRKD